MADVATERLYPTPFANSPLLPLLLLSLASQRHAPTTKKKFKDEYDYIIGKVFMLRSKYFSKNTHKLFVGFICKNCNSITEFTIHQEVISHQEPVLSNQKIGYLSNLSIICWQINNKYLSSWAGNSDHVHPIRIFFLSFSTKLIIFSVGAGAAGSVLASRLSEVKCVNVLLLEAGHDPPLLTEVPVSVRSFMGSDVDWQFTTEPQKNTGAGHVNRVS